MNGLIMRFRMQRCLRKLEKLWHNNNYIVTGETALKFSDTRGKLKVLRALEAAGCITSSHADNSSSPYLIRAGEKSVLYTLERSEIWLNRFIGFIAGVLTPIATHYIIRLLDAVFYQ